MPAVAARYRLTGDEQGAGWRGTVGSTWGTVVWSSENLQKDPNILTGLIYVPFDCFLLAMSALVVDPACQKCR
jgi:hypothetical protein